MVVEPILDSKPFDHRNYKNDFLFRFFNLVNGTLAELHSEASFALTYRICISVSDVYSRTRIQLMALVPVNRIASSNR